MNLSFLDAIGVGAIVLLYFGIPIGLGALVLTWVLRRHRRQLARDVQSMVAGECNPRFR